jgi:hypothetical protein
MKNLEYCKRQIQLSMLRAEWWLASATSGHYKQRKIAHGTVTNGGPEFTDDEKLAAAMATAQRHIELAAEFSESLAEAEEEVVKTGAARSKSDGATR